MQEPLIYENSIIESKDFTDVNLQGFSFDKVIFKQCKFINTNWGNATFSDCHFFECNISLVSLNNCQFNNVVFDQCKLIGLDFFKCQKIILSPQFTNSILHTCDFKQLSLKKILFTGSILKNVLFTATDLSEADFSHADLVGTVFEKCILIKADFRSAKNYSIDPRINTIKKARFSMPEVLKLLAYFDIDIA